MKGFGLLIMMAFVIFALSSSSCGRKPPVLPPITDTTDTTGGGGGGGGNPTADIIVTAKVGTTAGNPAGGAKVQLFLTSDSVSNNLVYKEGITDDNGIYRFNDVLPNKVYTIYGIVDFGGSPYEGFANDVPMTRTGQVKNAQVVLKN